MNTDHIFCAFTPLRQLVLWIYPSLSASGCLERLEERDTAERPDAMVDQTLLDQAFSDQGGVDARALDIGHSSCDELAELRLCGEISSARGVCAASFASLRMHERTHVIFNCSPLAGLQLISPTGR